MQTTVLILSKREDLREISDYIKELTRTTAIIKRKDLLVLETSEYKITIAPAKYNARGYKANIVLLDGDVTENDIGISPENLVCHSKSEYSDHIDICGFVAPIGLLDKMFNNDVVYIVMNKIVYDYDFVNIHTVTQNIIIAIDEMKSGYGRETYIHRLKTLEDLTDGDEGYWGSFENAIKSMVNCNIDNK